MARSGDEAFMPKHFWVVLGHDRTSLTISVLAFQLGDYEGAMAVGKERAREQSGVGGVEAFDLRLPTPRLRYHMELWLVGEGMPADEARTTVINLAKLLSKELKSIRRSRKDRK